MVWKFAHPGPRTIELGVVVDYDESNIPRVTLFHTSSSPKVPTVLHVNQESREEALRSYQIISTIPARHSQRHSDGDCSGHLCEMPDRINAYIDYSCDTVYLNNYYEYLDAHRYDTTLPYQLPALPFYLQYFVDQIPSDHLSRLQHLAINDESWEYDMFGSYSYSVEVANRIRSLSSLKSLIIVVGDNEGCDVDLGQIELRVPHTSNNGKLLDSYSLPAFWDPDGITSSLQEILEQSGAPEDLRKWLKDRVKVMTAYRGANLPRKLVGCRCSPSRRYCGLCKHLPYHPSSRHPDLIESADARMLEIIQERLDEVWKWSPSEEDEFKRCPFVEKHRVYLIGPHLMGA